MTFKLLNEIIKKNNIPENVILMSDSEWECGETNMNGVFYNEKENLIIFRQTGSSFDKYHKMKNWKCLYKKEE